MMVFRIVPPSLVNVSETGLRNVCAAGSE